MNMFPFKCKFPFKLKSFFFHYSSNTYPKSIAKNVCITRTPFQQGASIRNKPSSMNDIGGMPGESSARNPSTLPIRHIHRTSRAEEEIDGVQL